MLQIEVCIDIQANEKKKSNEKQATARLWNGALVGLIGDLQGLVDKFPGLPASDLHFNAGALVHLYVRLIRLWPFQCPYPWLYWFHQAPQLVRHWWTSPNIIESVEKRTASLQFLHSFIFFFQILISGG